MTSKKRLIQILCLVAVAGALAVVVSTLSASYLEGDKKSSEALCRDVNSEYAIVIQDNVMEPANVDAQLCDRLTVINKDPTLRQMAFGEHDEHVVYSGVGVTSLKEGQSYTFTLNQAGTFIVHDHFDDEVTATFTVND